jgi:hypothetical protein
MSSFAAKGENRKQTFLGLLSSSRESDRIEAIAVTKNPAAASLISTD